MFWRVVGPPKRVSLRLRTSETRLVASIYSSLYKPRCEGSRKLAAKDYTSTPQRITHATPQRITHATPRRITQARRKESHAQRRKESRAQRRKESHKHAANNYKSHRPHAFGCLFASSLLTLFFVLVHCCSSLSCVCLLGFLALCLSVGARSIGYIGQESKTNNETRSGGPKT